MINGKLYSAKKSVVLTSIPLWVIVQPDAYAINMTKCGRGGALRLQTVDISNENLFGSNYRLVLKYSQKCSPTFDVRIYKFY